MASYNCFANIPWHTESEFEAQTRILVGTNEDTDDVTPTIWQECRESAEAFILSNFLDNPRPNRGMLNRIPGELIPQFGKVLSTGSYTYSLLMPDLVTTPAQRMPVVWKNLSGAWQDRYDTDPLTYATDYSISGSSITIPGAEKGDVFCIEYETTLTPKPGILKAWSINKTSEYVFIRKYGFDHARVQAWAEQYGMHMERQLEMLRTGAMEIPEFASINLFTDWTEGGSTYMSIPVARV